MHSQWSRCPRSLPEDRELRKDRVFPELSSIEQSTESLWQKYCDDFDVAQSAGGGEVDFALELKE
eukprot:4675065-Karenia_brevis.AAC.1